MSTSRTDNFAVKLLQSCMPFKRPPKYVDIELYFRAGMFYRIFLEWVIQDVGVQIVEEMI